VVREYRLVDDRSTVSPLLVPKSGGNTEPGGRTNTMVWRGFAGQETMRESCQRHCGVCVNLV
jgi:hypothetical protein